MKARLALLLVGALANAASVASAPAPQQPEPPQPPQLRLERQPAAAKRIVGATASDPGDFYYYEGRPVRLHRSLSDVVARFKPEAPEERTASQASTSDRRALRVVTADREALASRDDVEFVAPVFYHPGTATRMLPTDEVVVKLKPGVTPEELNDLAAGLGLTVVKPMWRTTDEFVLRLDQPKSADALERSRALYESGRLEWAEPDFIQDMQKLGVPNDTRFGQQWHLNNTGQGGGVVGADVKAPAAWDLTTGNSGITIAIIDDGVQKTHEDLSANIFTNPGEIAGNGIDDDGNGYTDDVNGWDFSNNDNDASPMVADDNHGTAVAGVAAARGNNSLGVTGSCQNCKILPVKIATGTSFAADSAIGNAIRYASTLADVLSNSWGGGSPSSAIQSAILFANTNGRGGKGSVVLFASGNSASGLVSYVVSGFPPGTHRIRWEYSKNASVSSGNDTAWLAWVIFPGGSLTNFEGGGFPSGFTTGGNVSWSNVNDFAHADESSCYTRALKAGTISHNQTSYVQAVKSLPAGDLVFSAWVSSQAGLDGLSLQVDLGNDNSWELVTAPGDISGIPDVVSGVSYPAAHPESIAVGASTNFDCRSHYSQYGPELAFVSPSSGGPLNLAIETTDRTGASGYDAGNYTQATGASGFGGTSSATPLASGIAGLILSRNPTLTRLQVLQTMQNTADKVGSATYVSGRNDRYGYGRLNAQQALLATVIPPPTVATGAATGITTTGATLNGTVNPNAAATTVFFDYGPTAGYGSSTGGTGVGSGLANVATSGAVSGLACGTLYHYRARASNAGGATGGADLTFTTSACPPPTVTTLAASSIGPTSATFNGSVNPKDSATTVYFDYGADANYGSSTSGTDIGSGSATVPVSMIVPGLVCGTEYHYRVRAINTGGPVGGGDVMFTTGACPPPTVTTLAASAIGQTSATFNGSVNPNGSTTTVYFDYGGTAGYGSSTAGTGIGYGSSAVPVSMVVPGLVCGTEYHYRVRAINNGGPVGGGDVMFTTAACSPPTVTTLAATMIGQTGATLNGTVNPNGATTTVFFDYGPTAGYGTSTGGTGIGFGGAPMSVSADVTGLVCGTLYHFRARASNVGGATGGVDLTFTTSACPPIVTTQAATSVGSNSATLNASVNPNGAATTVVWDYGTTLSYGSTTSSNAIGSGVSPVPTSKAVTGLFCSTLYHFRARATNSGGTTNGSDLTFTTLACPPAPRQYVSVTGNDGNTCSNPATPCRTFVGAMNQLTGGGEIVVQDSGTFGGGTLDKALTINAPAGVAAVVATPLVVNAGASDVVTLRGLTFVSPTPGTGTALTFNGGAGLNLENTVIHGWSTGLSFAAAGKLNISDSTLRENTADGISLNTASGAIEASLERSQLLANGYGLRVLSNSKATVKDSVVSGNATGLFAGSAGGSELSVEDSMVSHNTVAGIWGDTTSVVRVSSSTIANNTVGLQQSGSGVVESRGGNTIEGNGTDTSGTIGTYPPK